ncbi:DUF4123 domain-containing protein [Neptuniibacter sp. PT8_73]|uniref:DUF4123 domain-containing protein n=1 Tax=Neptuniibacter sp. PT8_73 TaxID=3398206 RepID=UPI0039F48363
MIPIYDDALYCLILDHNRFHDNPLALIFQNEELPDVARLFDGTILESVAEEGPWCVFFKSDSELLYSEVIQQQWEQNVYWQAGSSLVIGLPNQPKEELLSWMQSRALAQSPLGNAMVFRFYSPALLDSLEQELTQSELTRFISGISEVIWAKGSFRNHGEITPEAIQTAYQLPEQFYKGLME